MKNSLSPTNKPAQKSVYLLSDFRQPDSRAAFYDWPTPPAVFPKRSNSIALKKAQQLERKRAAGKLWHQKQQRGFRLQKLNWRGEPYKNERRTRPLVHPDLPPKLYLDKAAYMAAWRAKKKAAK